MGKGEIAYNEHSVFHPFGELSATSIKLNMENSYFHYNIIQQNLLRLKMNIIVLLSLSYFFFYVLHRIIIYKSKTTVFSLQSNMIITSIFWKLTKVSTNNLKADIKGTSGRLEMCKNIVTV